MKKNVECSVNFSFVMTCNTLAVSVLPLVAALKCKELSTWRQLSVLLLVGKAWGSSTPSASPRIAVVESWEVNQQSKQAICTAESFTCSHSCAPFLCAGLLLSYCTHTKVHKCCFFFFFLKKHSCKTLLAGRKGSPNSYTISFHFCFGASSWKVSQSSKAWSELREYAHPSVFSRNSHSWAVVD